MKVEQHLWRPGVGWAQGQPGGLGGDAALVLVFGQRVHLEDPAGPMPAIREGWPAAQVIGCSTAGEIHGEEVLEGAVTAVAVAFEGTRVRAVSSQVSSTEGSRAAGVSLARSLAAPDLRHVLVLSDGLIVNGTELVEGLVQGLPSGVTVTGGLAGDGVSFERTVVIVDGYPRTHALVAVGLYGERLRVGFGSQGGWDPFGPERVVTRSTHNVLHQLDRQTALSLYKRYLGEHATGLPATGLLFPLSVRGEDDRRPVVRTVLAVDEKEQTMTFAGDIPQGSMVRLMSANLDHLVDGAIEAARRCQSVSGTDPSELALLISCVGRRLVLKQRVEEEVEGVREVLGDGPALTGFYSYGEICPFDGRSRAELHNQTMTVTTLREV